MADITQQEFDEFGERVEQDSNITDPRLEGDRRSHQNEDGSYEKPPVPRGMTEEERDGDVVSFISLERRAFSDADSIASEVWGMVIDAKHQLEGVEWSTFQMTVRKDRWVRPSGRDIIISASVQASGPFRGTPVPTVNDQEN